MKYEYQPADREIIFNDGDSDLRPIYYRLPSPPALELIDGYGKPPHEQMWVRQDMSHKLKELNERTDMEASEKVKHLESHQAYYEDEIEYIQRDIARCNSGYWLFINGKPYYITGDNYFYLMWWWIEGKPVQFRMRDRKWWLFTEMCDKDPNSYGFNYPKHRREGATTKVSCKRYRVAQRVPFARCGMQSKDYAHAEEIHRTMILDQFNSCVPFWHKPIWDNDKQNKTSMRFYAPDAKSHPDHGKKALKSIIDFRDSGLKAYDGLKVKFLHNDESGKTSGVNVKTRWEIQRQCLSDGGNIYGKCINTSTVDEMDKGGGKVFKELCEQSHYHKKTGANRTISGLYNLFIPASQGFDGVDADGRPFIDEFGFDRVGEDGILLSEKYHLAIRDGYKQAGDIEGLIEYTRQFPLRWKDCWKQSAKDCNFNLAIIEERLDHYRNGNPDVQRGNFMWKDGMRDGEVEWIPSPEGRWVLSFQFNDPRLANKSYKEGGYTYPMNTNRFVAGGDPYKFKLTKNGKQSMGAGAVFMYFDASIDGNKDIHDWQTHRFVCTYSFRPKNKEDYGEDMIMMCVYFGCKMFPEINIDFLWEYFERRGYVGYLYFAMDDKTGRVSTQPGAYTTDRIREEIFREWQYYIEKHGRRERHTELLEQCKDIEDDMGDYDLFAAGGYALLAAKKQPFTAEEATEEDVKDLFPTYYYNGSS